MREEPKRKRRIGAAGWRLAAHANAIAAAVLAAALFLMANYLASRFYWRWDWSAKGYYALSEKTRSLMGSLEGDVDVVVFFRRSHSLQTDIRALLREYEYVAATNRALRLRIQFVDPDRDIGRVRELMDRYSVGEPEVIVFERKGRRQYVDVRELAEYTLEMDGGQARRRMTGFRAEQAFTSALLSISQGETPVVYFLAGHGERDPGDYDENTGLSGIAKALRQDDVQLRPLFLAERQGVPADAGALVVAGPRRQLAAAEIDVLGSYLDRGGRLLALLDPGAPTGLEALLARWGVRVGDDVVVDPHRTLTGRELFVVDYGDHPVTRRLSGLGSVLYMPRSVSPVDEEAARPADVDRPRVTALATSSPDGWAESDPAHTPFAFDASADRRGPVPVACAAERGAVRNIAVGIKPTRVVVIGDSDFICNAALKGGAGGNVDFFLNAVNWLLERDSLLAIAPKPPNELRLNMTRRQLNFAVAAAVLGIPAAVAALGLAVWFRRRS